MILHTHALLGEVLAFRLGRETILLRTGWTQFDAQKRNRFSKSLPVISISSCMGYRKGVWADEKPVVVILLIVILLAALGGGWWWYQSSRQQPLTLYGNVDIRTVNMSFRVGGRLASLTVDEGDSIRAGQTLGELDRAPYENALLQARCQCLHRPRRSMT